jgi:hypothetical protein
VGYVIRHNITRHNLLQYRGQSLDANDARHNESGYRPLPKLSEYTDGEKEYLMQSLEGCTRSGAAILIHQYSEESFYSCGDRGCGIKIRPSGSLVKYFLS